MLNYPIDQRGENTLYEYLYSCIKRDITHQVLKAGERLPSKRSLAEHLSVSVITVEGAYAQLVAEGYVVSKPRSGYYVAHIPTRREDPALEMTSPASSAICATATGNLLAGAVPPDTARLSDTPSELAFCEPAALHTDTSTAAASDKNLTDAAHLWRRALKQTLAETPTHTLFSPAPAQGAAALRQAIAHYLSQERGLVVNPACIVIGPGAQALYGTLALLAEPHVQVAVEDPGFPALQSVYSAYGISTLPICVDAQGMQVGKLVHTSASWAHVMPSHQFPTGHVMSISRRYELLSWASAEIGRWIIEDDYDWEFRLAGRPIPALASIDTQGKVVYISTFSKSLGAGLRIAFMVLPPLLAARYQKICGAWGSQVTTLNQLVLAHAIHTGTYGRHVARMRTQIRAVRSALMSQIEHLCSPSVALEEPDSGLHCVVAISSHTSEAELAARAQAAGLTLVPLSHFAADPSNLPGDGLKRFVLSYQSLTPDLCKTAAQTLAGLTQRA